MDGLEVLRPAVYECIGTKLLIGNMHSKNVSEGFLKEQLTRVKNIFKPHWTFLEGSKPAADKNRDREQMRITVVHTKVTVRISETMLGCMLYISLDEWFSLWIELMWKIQYGFGFGRLDLFWLKLRVRWTSITIRGLLRRFPRIWDILHRQRKGYLQDDEYWKIWTKVHWHILPKVSHEVLQSPLSVWLCT